MIQTAINKVVKKQDLTQDESAAVMAEIMDGEVTAAQFGAFVTGLRCKGETVDEILGMVTVMRNKSLKVHTQGNVVDTCGTGGDDAGTFNVSTSAAFVVAGAGLKVAKHGNRAMSGRCGSADVLEELGVRIDLDHKQVEKCIDEIGIGFMYAPLYHPSMKHAAAPRREIGIKTIFNFLGPLCNPAGVKAQVIGVSEFNMMEKLAQVLCFSGCRHALVVCGGDGLDEITIGGLSHIIEVKEDSVRRYDIDAGMCGLAPVGLTGIQGGDKGENARILRRVMEGEPGPRRDATLINAAAALIAGDIVDSFRDGIAMAAESIDRGQACRKLNGLIHFSQGCRG